MTARNNAGQSGTTLVEAGDRNPGALFSQDIRNHAKTSVPCFLDSDILFRKKALPLKQVLRVGKLSYHELRAGKKVGIDQGIEWLACKTGAKSGIFRLPPGRGTTAGQKKQRVRDWQAGLLLWFLTCLCECRYCRNLGVASSSVGQGVSWASPAVSL